MRIHYVRECDKMCVSFGLIAVNLSLSTCRNKRLSEKSLLLIHEKCKDNNTRLCLKVIHSKYLIVTVSETIY